MYWKTKGKKNGDKTEKKHNGSQRNENLFSHKNMCKMFMTNFTDNIPKLETIQMFVGEWKVKQIVIYSPISIKLNNTNNGLGKEWRMSLKEKRYCLSIPKFIPIYFKHGFTYLGYFLKYITIPLLLPLFVLLYFLITSKIFYILYCLLINFRLKF